MMQGKARALCNTCKGREEKENRRLHSVKKALGEKKCLLKDKLSSKTR